MTLTAALTDSPSSLRTRDLWGAILVIGAHKLDLRQLVPRDELKWGNATRFVNVTPEMEEIRRCNDRIDALLVEEEDRNLREKRERVGKRGAA